jgi:hypothetical protein
MSESQEQHAAALIELVDSKFAVGSPTSHLREHEEIIHLTPRSPLSLCPSDNPGVQAVRPKLGEESQALEKWQTFGGHRINVGEPQGQGYIQTDFYVRTGVILMRRIVTYPGDYRPLIGETHQEKLRRRAQELLNRAQYLSSLTTTELNEENYGRPLTDDETEELFHWVNDTDIAQNSS